MMKQKNYLILGIVAALVIVGLILIGNYTEREEAIMPIEIWSIPQEIPSGILNVNKTINITVKLKTAEVDARILTENYDGKLVLKGKNITPSYKILWQGKIKKGIEKTYTIKITINNKDCFLNTEFYAPNYYKEGPWIDVHVIENKPNITRWEPPENISKQEAFPVQE